MRGSPTISHEGFRRRDDLSRRMGKFSNVRTRVNSGCNRSPVFSPDTYSIIGGTQGASFAIDSSTGAITVATALDRTATSSYALTVEADDGHGHDGSNDRYGQSQVTTTVSVTVVEALVVGIPTPETTVERIRINVSWDAVVGAAFYQVRHRLAGADAGPDSWTQSTEVTGTSHTLNVDRGYTYELQLRAYGNGTTHGAQWGEWSASATTTTQFPPLPGGFASSTTTASSVTLTWSPLDCAASYQVE